MTTKLEFRRVGIGMPVYNGEAFLEESIQSNLAQTYEDFTLVIADNASTDRTQEICEDYARTDPRIHYVRNKENLGASKNYTRCFEPANCEYFRWANADDLADPTLVENCVRILDKHPDVILTYGKTLLIDNGGSVTEHYDDNLDLQQDNAFERFTGCMDNIGLSNVLYGLMRRKIVAQTGLLGNYIASDINLIAELTLYGKFHEIPEFLFSRRMHVTASSWDRADEETQRSFWDPTVTKLLMQKWRSFVEYFRAVNRAPIPSSDKRRIRKRLLKMMYWEKSTLCREPLDYAILRVLK